MKTSFTKFLILFIIIHNIKCEDLPIGSKSLWDLVENGPSTCGKTKMVFGTAFHGTQVKRGAYPWNVALTKSSDGKLLCGGSLISNKLVVTAAHCIEGKGRLYLFRPRDIFVVLGAHDLEARREPSRITASVKSIYVHHDWNPYTTSYDADIAILELEDEVTFNRYIQPICLATPDSEAAYKIDGIVAGFGKSEHRDIENIARVISTPIHSYEFCSNSSDHETLLTHRTFCGGYANGTSVCRGDSGSGLIVKHKGVYYLRGIVSALLYDTLIGCNINAYSIFTDVLKFYSWLTTGKDEQTLLRELQDEIRRLRGQSTTTRRPTTTRRSVSRSITRKLSGYLRIDGNIIRVKKYQGSQASDHEFAHQAILGYDNNNPLGYTSAYTINWLCGGSLISPNFVLTAAQCLNLGFYSVPKFVKLGMNHRLQEYGKTRIYSIDDVFTPDNFNPKMPDYEKFVGIVKLNESVNYGESICSVCLPSTQPEDVSALVSGFPEEYNFHGVTEDLLKYLLQKQSREECNTIFKANARDQDKNFCYGSNLVNARCSFTEGSPLQVLNDDQSKCIYTQIGVLSVQTKGCANAKYGFINIYKNIDWIKEIVGGDEELDKNVCNIILE